MFKYLGGGALAAYGVVMGVGVVGWVMNLVTLIGLFVHNAPISALFVGRVIGVVVPVIGAVLGWF